MAGSDNTIEKSYEQCICKARNRIQEATRLQNDLKELRQSLDGCDTVTELQKIHERGKAYISDIHKKSEDMKAAMRKCQQCKIQFCKTTIEPLVTKYYSTLYKCLPTLFKVDSISKLDGVLRRGI